jgi:hypothetical protein
MPQRSQIAERVAHSWDLEHWPEHVYPHNTGRARYLVRVYKGELVAAGVLCRVGRELVFFGERYVRWLERRRADVPGYVIPPKRERRA